ncbi:MAG: hypothetical protein UT48_C0038G0001, partial [Parcubacteria group bacterium GW2011_GWE2_39_37]
KTAKKLSEKEKIEKIKNIYQKFSKIVFDIEKKRDEKLTKIIKEIDKRKIEKLIKEIKNS